MAAVVTLKKTGKLGAGLKYAVGTVAMDSSYPTGGEAIVPLSDLGLNEVYGGIVGASLGYELSYDVTNKKIMAYYGDYDAVADGPLIQVADKTDISAITAAPFFFWGW